MTLKSLTPDYLECRAVVSTKQRAMDPIQSIGKKLLLIIRVRDIVRLQLVRDYDSSQFRIDEGESKLEVVFVIYPHLQRDRSGAFSTKKIQGNFWNFINTLTLTLTNL